MKNFIFSIEREKERDHTRTDAEQYASQLLGSRGIKMKVLGFFKWGKQICMTSSSFKRALVFFQLCVDTRIYVVEYHLPVLLLNVLKMTD